MKKSFIRQAALLGICAGFLSQTANYSTPLSFLVDQPVPDGLDTGIASTEVVTGLSGVISHISVDLNLSGRGTGGWNGDLYVTLVHDSGFSVLLNRPGKSALDQLGFDDIGFNITLDDSAAKDIQNYRNN